MFDALREKLTHRKPRPESDAPGDTGVAWSRDEGGVPNPDAPDQQSTTGTTPNEEFVGRAQGQDVGYAGETGAERRADADRDV